MKVSLGSDLKWLINSIVLIFHDKLQNYSRASLQTTSELRQSSEKSHQHQSPKMLLNSTGIKFCGWYQLWGLTVLGNHYLKPFSPYLSLFIKIPQPLFSFLHKIHGVTVVLRSCWCYGPIMVAVKNNINVSFSDVFVSSVHWSVFLYFSQSCQKQTKCTIKLSLPGTVKPGLKTTSLLRSPFHWQMLLLHVQ